MYWGLQRPGETRARLTLYMRCCHYAAELGLYVWPFSRIIGLGE